MKSDKGQTWRGTKRRQRAGRRLRVEPLEGKLLLAALPVGAAHMMDRPDEPGPTAFHAAIAPHGTEGDSQTSIVYDANTGEVAVDAPAGVDLTSIHLQSALGIFTGKPAEHLGGIFDTDDDRGIFKATFGGSFGSLSFGRVAQPGLSEEFLLADLSVTGSLAVGGGLADVDLVYIVDAEPIVVDDLDGAASFTTTGTWRQSSATDEYVGSSLYATDAGATATWYPDRLSAAVYDVYVWYSGVTSSGGTFDRDSEARYTIAHAHGTDTVTVDQDVDSGQWIFLATYAFDGDGSDRVTLTSSGTGANGTSADAVRFVPNARKQLLVSDTNLTVPEGGNESFTVRLSAPPASDVAVSITKLAGGDLELTSDTSTLVFSPSAWNIPQTVTIRAAQDGDSSNGSASFEISAPGIAAQTVIATEADDDVTLIEVDDLDGTPRFTTTGTWRQSSAVDEFRGSSSYTTDAGATAVWNPGPFPAGTYDVQVWYSGVTTTGSTFNRDSQARYTITHAHGTDTVIVDQDLNSGRWVPLGSYAFDGGGSERVTLTSSGTGPSGTSADAVRFVPVATTQFVVSETALTVPEGGSQSFAVQLSERPASDVTVSISKIVGGDPDLNVNTSTLQFTSATWSRPQTVTVHASQDGDATNGAASFYLSAPGMPAQTVTATEADDDVVLFFVDVDNLDGPSHFTTTGTWYESSAVDEYLGSSVYATEDGAAAVWNPGTLSAGKYDVYVWYSAITNGGGTFDRDSQAQYTITHAFGTHTVTLDQDGSSGRWRFLGTYTFVGDGSEQVTVTSSGTAPNGTSADAVRFVSW